MYEYIRIYIYIYAYDLRYLLYIYIYIYNWSPPGGSTAAQSFRSLDPCDKEGSLEEESLEIWVFLKAFVRIFFSALSSAGSWILGFVLGKFLDFLGKVGWRPHQERRKPRQERAGENMPKVSQEAPKNHPKIIENRGLTPPKIEAKRLLNGLQKQVRIQNRSWGATR